MPKKRIKHIIIYSLITFIVLLLILLTGAIIYSATYKIPKQDKKISNNTGLVQAHNRSLYDKNGLQLKLNGVNIGNLFIQEGWLSPFAGEPLKNKDGSYQKDKDGNLLYPEFTEDEFREGIKANPHLKNHSFESLANIYYTNFFNEQDVIYIKNELKMNSIRLPFYWRNILNDDLSFKPKEEAFYYIDYVLELCKKHDLYVILDLHGVPKSQNGSEHSGTLKYGQGFWKNKHYQDVICDLWKYVSNYYTHDKKDLGSIIATYDILNEPRIGRYANKEVWQYLDRLYNAIRENNDNHVITIESCWDYNNLPNPNKYGWENIQYSYHHYNFDHLPFNFFFFIKDLTNIGRDYNVPVSIGEFSFFEYQDQWQKGLKLYDERNYSWSMWTYKAASIGWWTTSWAILTRPMYLDTTSEKTKPNIKTCTYEEFIKACELMNINNGGFQTGTLYEVIKKYNNQ